MSRVCLYYCLTEWERLQGMILKDRDCDLCHFAMNFDLLTSEYCKLLSICKILPVNIFFSVKKSFRYVMFWGCQLYLLVF